MYPFMMVARRPNIANDKGALSYEIMSCCDGLWLEQAPLRA
jgi:hypothetical protein